MNTSELRDSIVEAAQEQSDVTTILPLTGVGENLTNELLFFFKPETFANDQVTSQAAVVEMALQAFDAFDVVVAGAAIIGGGELGARQSMDRHYGFINRLSRSASASLTQSEISEMKSVLGPEYGEGVVLGGHEALEWFSTLDPSSLDGIWSSESSHRLKGGLYFQGYEIEAQSVILVNGFHPAQLAHYTDPRQKICLLVVRSNTSWSILRNRMVGNTFPSDAELGSIRRELLESRESLALGDVSVGRNYCHLSAGPFEALFEMNNFLGEADNLLGFKLGSTRVARMLESRGLNSAKIERVLDDPLVSYLGQQHTVFSATEDMDTGDACALYAEASEAVAGLSVEEP